MLCWPLAPTFFRVRELNADTQYLFLKYLLEVCTMYISITPGPSSETAFHLVEDTAAQVRISTADSQRLTRTSTESMGRSHFQNSWGRCEWCDGMTGASWSESSASVLLRLGHLTWMGAGVPGGAYPFRELQGGGLSGWAPSSSLGDLDGERFCSKSGGPSAQSGARLAGFAVHSHQPPDKEAPEPV